MTNVAVWGLGSHATRNTLPALQLSEVCNLYGVYTRNEDNRNTIAAKYGIKQWKSSDDLLNDSTVDAVYIATPTGIHFEQVKAALEKGKHVYCEKALVVRREQSEMLFDIAQRANLVLAECLMYFYHNQFSIIKELLGNGEIGELQTVFARFGYPHIPEDNIRYQKALGGGALLDAGVYPLSALVELSSGQLDSFTGHIFHTDDFDVDVRGSCLSRYGDVCFHGEWGMGRDYANEIEFWGSAGKLIVPRAFSKPSQLRTFLRLIKNGKETEIEVTPDNHFLHMFDHFARMEQDTKENQWLQQRSLKIAELIGSLFIQSRG